MNTRKFGAITSSTNPDEIANRVKGAVLAASAIIIFIAANVFKITLSPQDVIDLAAGSGAVAGAIWTVYGFGLWILTKFFKHDHV